MVSVIKGTRLIQSKPLVAFLITEKKLLKDTNNIKSPPE